MRKFFRIVCPPLFCVAKNEKRLIFHLRYAMIKTFGQKGGSIMPNMGLTHFDEGGAAIMVDVSGKEKAAASM